MYICDTAFICIFGEVYWASKMSSPSERPFEPNKQSLVLGGLRDLQIALQCDKLNSLVEVTG